MNTFQILMSKPRFDLMHCNVSIGSDKWPIFGCFLTLFPARREKNISVMDDVTRKCSLDVQSTMAVAIYLTEQ
jgi:hypothetical protein